MKPTSITINLALLLLPAPILAVRGGRCSGNYNDGRCICLDSNACRGYGGNAVAGSAGNWPCPNDAANIQGCYILNGCPTIGGNTACVWSNACGSFGYPLSSESHRFPR